MKVSIELALRTREVYQLFQRRIDRNQLFIEAILHKFNIVMNRCRQQRPQALSSYKQMNQRITEVTQQFADEIVLFEALLAKKNDFASTKINYITQFRPIIIVANALSVQLIEFIEIYDKLIAALKLLQLAGCFESDEIFWGNTKRYQKIANQMLSTLVLTPAIIR
jgi:hypothetical protein